MKVSNGKRALTGLFLLFLIFGSAEKGSAFHTYHSSLTRIDYNSNEKLFEITIQLFTHDVVPLMKTLSAGSKENEAEYDKALLKYVGENFELSNEKGSIGDLVWVGKETKVDVVYVYVEIPYDGASTDFKLKNSILFDLFPTQKNLVTLTIGEKRSDLFFINGDKFKKLEFRGED